MPTVLREHQVELLDANRESRSLLFGTEDTGYLNLKPPAWSSGDPRDDDVDRPHEDGRLFGIDLRGGASIGFEIGVLTDARSIGTSDAYTSNDDYLDALQSWWDDEDLRLHPEDLAVLRTCVAGRTWRAYGRPRRFDAVEGVLKQQGYTPVVCDFDVVDNRVYSDIIQSQPMQLVVPPDGGIVEPLTAPITATMSSVNHDTFTIGGSRSTWPWIQFVGPVLNPQVVLEYLGPQTPDPVRFPPLTIGLTASIPDDMTITVDPRPWSRGVLREDGANYAGSLSVATSILREMRLRPGQYRATFSGTDATGTSQCNINWRLARSRP
jgi:hypothetical protein